MPGHESKREATKQAVLRWLHLGMPRQATTTIRLHVGVTEPSRCAVEDSMSNAEVAAVIAALPFTTLVLDRERRIVAYSGPRDPALFVGKDALDLIVDDQRDFHDRQLRRVLHGGEIVTYDIEVKGRKPAEWIRVRLAPLAVDGDIRGVVYVGMDIEHERAVQRRADRLRATFDHVDEGMLVVDLATGHVIECNEAAARLLQVPHEELTATAPSWLQLSPEGSARLGWGALLDELVDGRTLRGRAILREGQELSMELRATSRKLDDHTFAFVLCRDISADLVRERARATQERLATVGSLAAGVAHEINNPLAYVIANVQYALDSIAQWPTPRAPLDGGDDDTQHSALLRERAQLQEALVEANEGARRVQRIVADLKTLARQGDDRVEPIDVEHTLNWAIGVTMAEIRHRARLVKNFEKVSTVRGDEARLGQVFVNVLLNAAQAIEPGNALDNEIIVNTREVDGQVVVEVLDSGVGIPEENLTKIFDPFFTTKPRGIGTGLGLSICHEIIASMRGSLTAENHAPHGAKFVVQMPALSAYQSQVAMQLRQAKSTRPPMRTGNILIIDDESLAAKALGRMLRDHKVVLADHAPTGMRMAIENSYDVIFCDLMMPELSGMAVHAAVQRENPQAAARMVFITGGTFTEEARAFATHHAARCLFKPFDSSLVKGAVERLLTNE
ncbi:MAG: sensor hybrid histidine kinase [Myxococcaceae bacterium]|nr:sensor hybrid histidine kinase [Myxococcaceae bacterium]